MKYLCDCYDASGEYVDTVTVETNDNATEAARFAVGAFSEQWDRSVVHVRVADSEGRLIEIVNL